MTDRQAQTKAKKLWGKKFAVRNSGKISGAERRQAATERIAELRAKRDALLQEKAERLKALDWLTKLDAEVADLNKAIREVIPETHRYCFDVGRIMGVAGVQFFEVLGSGDTWEEAFAKAEAKEAA